MQFGVYYGLLAGTAKWIGETEWLRDDWLVCWSVVYTVKPLSKHLGVTCSDCAIEAYLTATRRVFF